MAAAATASSSTITRWRAMSNYSPIPENAYYRDGIYMGHPVYIGRVIDATGFYIGNVISESGYCLYLNKSRRIEVTPTYDILLDIKEDELEFSQVLGNQIFIAGIEDNTHSYMYIGRHVDRNRNTYYGYISHTTGHLVIPMHSYEGPQVLDNNFDVLVHKPTVQYINPPPQYINLQPQFLNIQPQYINPNINPYK